MNIFRPYTIAITIFLFSQATFASLIIVGKNDASNQAKLSYDGNTIELTNNSTGVITGFGFYSSTNELELDEVEGTGDDDAWDLLTGKKAMSYQFAVGTGKNLFGGKVSEGIAKGDTGVFTFDLDDAQAFSNVYKVFVRFQETENEEGSDKGYQCLRDDGCKPVTVTEPGTIALMGIGLFGLLASRKRLNF